MAGLAFAGISLFTLWGLLERGERRGLETMGVAVGGKEQDEAMIHLVDGGGVSSGLYLSAVARFE